MSIGQIAALARGARGVKKVTRVPRGDVECGLFTGAPRATSRLSDLSHCLVSRRTTPGSVCTAPRFFFHHVLAARRSRSPSRTVQPFGDDNACDEDTFVDEIPEAYVCDCLCKPSEPFL